MTKIEKNTAPRFPGFRAVQRDECRVARIRISKIEMVVMNSEGRIGVGVDNQRELWISRAAEPICCAEFGPGISARAASSERRTFRFMILRSKEVCRIEKGADGFGRRRPSKEKTVRE